MITMGIYKNENKKLPHKPGRVWYEADINYYSGKETDTVFCGQMTDLSL